MKNLKRVIATVLVAIIGLSVISCTQTPSGGGGPTVDELRLQCIEEICDESQAFYETNKDSDSASTRAVAYYRKRVGDEARSLFNAAADKAEIENIYEEYSNRIKLQAYMRMTLSVPTELWFDGCFTVSGEIDGVSYQIERTTVSPLSSVNQTLKVSSDDEESISFTITTSNPEYFEEGASEFEITTTGGSSGIRSWQAMDKEGYIGIIICKDSSPIGYVVTNYRNTWYRAERFVLEDGHSVTMEQARSFTSLILDGKEDATLEGVSVEPLEASFSCIGETGIEVENSKDKEEPYVSFSSGESGNVEFSVYSSKAFDFAGESVKRATVSSGDGISWAGGEGYLAVLTQKDGEVQKLTLIVFYSPGAAGERTAAVKAECDFSLNTDFTSSVDGFTEEDIMDVIVHAVANYILSCEI